MKGAGGGAGGDGLSGAAGGAGAIAAVGAPAGPSPKKPRRLTYKEMKEMEQLEKDIAALEDEKASLEELLSGGTADYAALQAASTRFGLVKDALDTAELRWLELSDL